MEVYADVEGVEVHTGACRNTHATGMGVYGMERLQGRRVIVAVGYSK